MVWAMRKPIPRIFRPIHRAARWISSPSPPISPNRAKRMGMTRPIHLSANSIPNSQATNVSSLVSPYCRFSETVGKLTHTKRLGRESKEVKQDFETFPGHAVQRSLEYVTSAHKEPAQRIRDVGLTDDPRQARR